jgi:hypothetical protein
MGQVGEMFEWVLCLDQRGTLMDKTSKRIEVPKFGPVRGVRSKKASQAL